MKELAVIQQQEILGKPFTLYGDFENPLFLAKEVAEWIEHSNVSMMLQTIDDDEKVVNIVYTLGGNQEAWFLTENGVYEVLMQSRKPIAKQFKKEVKAVLRSIRKHGAYITAEKLEEMLLTPDTLIKLCTALKQEQQKNKKLEAEIVVKNQLLAECSEKESYYDVVLKTEDPVAISRIARDYGMSPNQMNVILQEKGVQFQIGGEWFLNEEYIGRGYKRTKKSLYTNKKGIGHYNYYNLWTQKGRLLIYELLKKDGILPLIEKKDTPYISCISIGK